jgi:hypothetical protein
MEEEEELGAGGQQLRRKPAILLTAPVAAEIVE